MRIKLDENIPQEARGLFPDEIDVHTVSEEGLSGTDDESLWEKVQTENRFFITQDLDFSDLASFLPGTHAGILLVRIKNPSRAQLLERLSSLIGRGDFVTWSGCFVVLSDSKLRIRWP